MRATVLDPEYALAWSGLADAYAASPINCDAPPLEVWPRARDYTAAVQFARQATVLDPGFGLDTFSSSTSSWATAGCIAERRAALRQQQQGGGAPGVLVRKLGRTDKAQEVLNILEAVSREQRFAAS